MQNGRRSIYLSGSIRKGGGDLRSSEHFWTAREEALIREQIGEPVDLLNPARMDIRRQDARLNFGCDLHLVAISDVLLVDARTDKGIGIGAEMMFAVQNGIPVVTWAPPDTHYRRSRLADVFGEDLTDWTHPFIQGLSDYVADDLEEAVAVIRDMFQGIMPTQRADPQREMERYRRSIAGERFLDLGAGVAQDTRGGGAEIETIRGAVKHRFMDVLYLPQPTHLLSPEALIAVNRWREDRIGQRPLLHSERVRRVIRRIASDARSTGTMLEIGCGKFPLADDLLDRAWLGLDPDVEAVAELRRRGLKAATDPRQLSQDASTIELVVSLFAMQFAIGTDTFDLIAAIPDTALLVFNLPTRDEALVQRRLSELLRVGYRARTLDLTPVGAHDRIVVAHRLSGGPGQEVLDSVVDQVEREWPQVAGKVGWSEA